MNLVSSLFEKRRLETQTDFSKVVNLIWGSSALLLGKRRRGLAFFELISTTGIETEDVLMSREVSSHRPFAVLCKRKLTEVENGLFKLELMPLRKTI